MSAMTPPEWWDSASFARRRPYLETRALIAASLRSWFAAERFIEVDTPSLQISPGMEPHLKAFRTEWETPDGAALTRYLHTSPEFAMKKLLAAGMTRIFQLGHVFRNGERGTTHSPEFTMLEWYRVGAGLDDLVTDCAALLRAACVAADTALLKFRGRTCDPFAEPEILPVPEAFRRYCGIELLATAPDPAKPDLALLARATAPLGIAPHDGDSWEDLFFRVMFEHIEPRLGDDRPTILCDYPVSMAALARPKPADPRLGDRLEG